MKNDKINLATLLLLSLLLSIYLFFRTYAISLDGAFQYIPIAKDFASRFFRRALSHNQQPLYPLIIAFVSRWVPDFELAGKLVSSFFGILIIFPVYFLGKRIFDQKIAFLSSLFMVIHPYVRRFSADVLKESTFLFFFGIAIWFAWRTIQNEKRYPFLFVPILSVLAYLVRPDGVEVLLVVFFYVFLVKKFGVSGRKRTVILLLILSSCIMLLPYLFYLRELRGEWTFGKAKSILEMLGLGALKDGVSLPHRILFSFKRLNSEILGTLHVLYIFLLIIGLFRRVFVRLKAGEGFLLCFCCLHYMILFLMVLNTTEWREDGTIKAIYLSGRHVLAFLLVSIYWVGEGFMAIYLWVFSYMTSHSLFFSLKSKNKSLMVLGLLLVAMLAVILPKTLKPQRYERLPEKWAGKWVRNQSGEGTTIFTSMPLTAFYADGNCEYIDLRKSTIDKIKASMIEKKALYLVIREKDFSDYQEEAKLIQREFVEMIRFGKEGMEKIIIYKVISWQIPKVGLFDRSIKVCFNHSNADWFIQTPSRALSTWQLQIFKTPNFA